MNVNGNDIVIEIGASSKSAAENIRELSSALKDFKSATSGSTKGMSNLSKKMTDLVKSINGVSGSAKKLNSISKLFDSIGNLGQVKIPKSLPENLSSIATAVKDVSSQAINNLDKMTSALQRLSGVDLKGFKDVAEQSSAASVQARVAEATSGRKTSVGKDAAKYERELNRIDKSIERTQKKIAAFKKELAIEQSTEGGGDAEKVKNYNAAIEEQVELLDKLIEQRKRLAEADKEPSKFSAIIDGFKKTLSNLGGALKSAGRGILSFGKTLITLPFKKAISGVSEFTKKIGTLASSFKRILFYRAIRTVIKKIGDAFREGTQNLYYYSQGIGGQFAASMDMAATSMLYFKNSIGAAVAPLVNALAPVLDMIVDKVVAVINAINQLFAKLTGASSWTRAIKYPKQYGDAVSGAGKAAKEALRYLAPFDELNVLPSDRGGGSGAGGLADDYSSMFEEMSEFNREIADFAKNIREAIEKSDWKGLGELIGGKVNEIVDQIDFAGAGKKIGYYINAWFTTKYWTLETINFTNIGGKIAEFLNNAIYEIDFETIGRAFVRGFTLIFDLAIGFVSNLDWKQVGKSVGDYLRGAFNEISDWSKTVNWSEFGKNLWTDVMNFIAGIDFGSLAKSFFSFLGSAFGAAVSVIGGFFVGVWESVREYFRKKTEEAGGDTWEGFKRGVTDAWRGIKEWVKSNVIDPFVNSVKSLLGIHSPSTVFANIGINIVQGLWNGVKSTWDKFIGWFSQKWNGLKNWWSGLSLGTFHFKLPHLSWYTEPASGWVGSVLRTLGLPASIPKLSVSWYAKGGIVDGASLIGAGEAGKEAIVPLERNTQWVGMVADQLSNQLGNRNGGGYNADLAGDLEDANGVVVSAIFSATAEIVRAMQRNSGSVQGGNIDIDSIARQVTRWQNNAARANGI